VPDDRRRQRSRRLAVIGTMLAIFLLVAFISFPLFSGVVAPFVPQRVVDAVGAEMIKDTASKGSFCVAPEGKAALRRLVERLAASAGEREFKIYVSDQEVVNAFAAPGGHIVIYQPILAQAASAEEVAGVLAHEMGHVVEDHPTQALVEAVGYGIFNAMTPGDAETQQVAKSLLTNHYSRSHELDADRHGVALLNAAGIDSRGLFTFFERMKESGDDIPGALQYLSTHPSGDTRRHNLEDVAHEGEPALDEAEWKALREICSQTGAPEPIVVQGAEG
jgi:predicted Zn-dependent protease